MKGTIEDGLSSSWNSMLDDALDVCYTNKVESTGKTDATLSLPQGTTSVDEDAVFGTFGLQHEHTKVSKQMRAWRGK